MYIYYSVLHIHRPKSWHAPVAVTTVFSTPDDGRRKLTKHAVVNRNQYCPKLHLVGSSYIIGLWCTETHHHYHHHHVPEGLGVFSVPWSSKWSWSLHLFFGRPMFLHPFGLYCSACFGILFVSILCTCCSHGNSNIRFKFSILRLFMIVQFNP